MAEEVRRRGVLDDIKRGEICAILAVGCSRATAARYVGCHSITIRRTAERDEAFKSALLQAESKHEVLHLSYINKAAKEGRYWRAAAWALERKYPDRWGQRDPHQFSLRQVSEVLSQFAAVVLEEIPERTLRARIRIRLHELTKALQSAPAKGARK
jgi:hypothetical protein